MSGTTTDIRKCLEDLLKLGNARRCHLPPSDNPALTMGECGSNCGCGAWFEVLRPAQEILKKLDTLPQ